MCLFEVAVLSFRTLSWTQEARQTHIVENGTHAEGTEADGNAGDSTVMPPPLFLSITQSFHM